jgi:hypothetical protein
MYLVANVDNSFFFFSAVLVTRCDVCAISIDLGGKYNESIAKHNQGVQLPKNAGRTGEGIDFHLGRLFDESEDGVKSAKRDRSDTRDERKGETRHTYVKEDHQQLTRRLYERAPW